MLWSHLVTKVQNIHQLRFEKKSKRGKPCYLEHNTHKYLTLRYNLKRHYLQKLLSFNWLRQSFQIEPLNAHFWQGSEETPMWSTLGLDWHKMRVQFITTLSTACSVWYMYIPFLLKKTNVLQNNVAHFPHLWTSLR